MILIFGGTTEGRYTVKVCEEASKPFYYSTKNNLQEILLANGIRLSGGLDQLSMPLFCKEKNIRLIIDAAHPFAINLHDTISKVSDDLNIPVIRYERNYVEDFENILWFDSYDDAVDYLEKHKIEKLLALTGVNTISKFKRYWQNHFCWFRILDREDSRKIVEETGFPIENVLYYKQDNDEKALFEKLKPQAIITKESGESGGFKEKIIAAQQLNIPVLVIKRPQLSASFISVYGENGLRKKIEQLLPDFFELKTGYTTGTCATAATKAALTALLTKEMQTETSITLPNGEWVKIPINSTIFKENCVTCSVIKDSGDDPDVTNGLEILSTVNLNSNIRGVKFLEGEGVGIVTLPGLGLEIGDPAINATPRKMIKREVYKVMRHNQDKLPNHNLKIGVDVTISVPQGKEIAKRTFNPKLGIVDGISIIGTSGIVKPFSSEAFIRSIRREMQVAKAIGCNHVIINSGAKSERFVKQIYPELPNQAFIHYGNFIGETIKIASDLDISKVTMGIMIGKAVKLAEGSLDTHSKKVVMNKDFLVSIANDVGCSQNTIDSIATMTLARQLWDIIPQSEIKFFDILLQKCYNTTAFLLPKGELNILLIDESGNIIR